MVLLIAVTVNSGSDGASVGSTVDGSVGASVVASVGASVGSSAGASVGSSVGDSVFCTVVASVIASVGEIVVIVASSSAFVLHPVSSRSASSKAKILFMFLSFCVLFSGFAILIGHKLSCLGFIFPEFFLRQSPCLSRQGLVRLDM